MYTSDYNPDTAPDFLLPNQPQVQDLVNQGAVAEPAVPVINNPASSPATGSAARKRGAGQRGNAGLSGTEEPATSKIEDLRIFRHLEANTLVYKSADMLGVENLKVLAADRVLADARLAFVKPQFAETLARVFESTRSDDEHVRIPTIALCVENHEIIASVPQIVAVLEQYEYCAWKMQRLVPKAGAWQKQLNDSVVKINARLHLGCCNSLRPVSSFRVDTDGSISSYCNVGFHWQKI